MRALKPRVRAQSRVMHRRATLAPRARAASTPSSTPSLPPLQQPSSSCCSVEPGGGGRGSGSPTHLHLACDGDVHVRAARGQYALAPLHVKRMSLGPVDPPASAVASTGGGRGEQARAGNEGGAGAEWREDSAAAAASDEDRCRAHRMELAVFSTNKFAKLRVSKGKGKGVAAAAPIVTEAEVQPQGARERFLRAAKATRTAAEAASAAEDAANGGPLVHEQANSKTLSTRTLLPKHAQGLRECRGVPALYAPHHSGAADRAVSDLME